MKATSRLKHLLVDGIKKDHANAASVVLDRETLDDVSSFLRGRENYYTVGVDHAE
jgi:hypothetical protein